MATKNIWRTIVFLSLFSVAVQIPYLRQSFHIDDNIFLMVAENFRVHRWFPQDLRTYFEGLRVDDFISHEHPLLLSSLCLLPSVTARFQPELLGHLTYLVFYVLLIVSTYLLARPLTEDAWEAAILTGLSPAVFLSSHTVMSDLPYAALIYFAVAMAVASSPVAAMGTVSGAPAACCPDGLRVKDGEGGFLPCLSANLVAGLSCAAAAMFSYQALFFVPLVYFAGRRQVGRTWIWLLPLTAVLAYGVVNSFHFGRFIWWDLFAFWFQQPTSGGGLRGRLTYSLLALLGTITFPLAWVVLLAMDRVRVHEPCELASKVCNGVLPGRTSQILAAIIAVNVFLIIFVYRIGAVRYLLPVAPVICIFAVASIRGIASNWWRIVMYGGLLGSTAILSILLAHADYEWAGFYSSAARIIPEYRSHQVKVWIAGEWGFRWYFTHQGGTVLGRADNRPQPGDVLIRPKLASPYLTLYDGEPGALVLERTIQFHPSTPVRLLDFQSHAGFYSSGWGLLPFSLNLSEQTLEEIFVFRVKKAVPPAVREPTYWEWNR